MDEDRIKELISKNFIRTIANRQGYDVSIPDQDYGVDLQIVEVVKILRGKKKRYLGSGKQIELQLKCTTEKGVKYSDGKIKYSLKSKNYDDLIDRLSNNIPLFLVLFILPSDAEKWVFCDDKMLKIEKHAFWYLPKSTDKRTENKGSVTIEFSEANILTKNTFKELFDLTYSF